MTVLAGLVLGAGAVAAALEPESSPGTSFHNEVHDVPAVPYQSPDVDQEFEFEFEQPPTLEPPAVPEIEVEPVMPGRIEP